MYAIWLEQHEQKFYTVNDTELIKVHAVCVVARVLDMSSHQGNVQTRLLENCIPINIPLRSSWLCDLLRCGLHRNHGNDGHDLLHGDSLDRGITTVEARFERAMGVFEERLIRRRED